MIRINKWIFLKNVVQTLNQIHKMENNFYYKTPFVVVRAAWNIVFGFTVNMDII